MEGTNKDQDPGYNPDVTDEDLENLGKKGTSMNPGADSRLRRRKKDIDFEGKDLDIPGRDPEETPQGPEQADEENKHYSTGGPGKEGLEERKDSEEPPRGD